MSYKNKSGRNHHLTPQSTPQSGVSLSEGDNHVSLVGHGMVTMTGAIVSATEMADTTSIIAALPSVLLQAIVVLGEKTGEGHLIEAVAPAWREIRRSALRRYCTG